MPPINECYSFWLRSPSYSGGVCGASDEVFGAVECVDFEKRIAGIHKRCGIPAEIDASGGPT